MYIFMIIISILLIIPAFLLAEKYMLDEKKRLKNKIKKGLMKILPSYIIAITLSKIIVGILLKDHLFMEYPLLRGISECGLAVSISYIIIYIVMNVWNKRHERYHKLRNIWIFLVIFINEIAAIARIVALPSIEAEIPGLLLQFVLDIGVYLILFNLLAKDKIVKELEELHYHMEVEKIRYQEMYNEREMMAKIRHDYNNQLTSVLGLLHMKREDEAKELLKEMRSGYYD